MKVALLLLITLFTAGSISPCVAQDDSERDQAFELFRTGRVSDALPLFEKLAKSNPWDRDVLEALGYLVLGQAVYAPDASARKVARLRGRDLLLRAQQLGANSPLLKSTLATIPADGGDDVSFSSRKEVDDAMREGEAAFANRDYQKAIQGYQHALAVDPRLYEAAVFTADAYFQLGRHEAAGEWYAKAIAIDPNRETAYRYWGDVLMKQDKMAEARDKLIEAYIRDPYNRLTQASLVAWGRANKSTLAHPEVEIPTSVSHGDGGNTTINLDANLFKKEKDPGAAAWIYYGLVRAGWTKKFATEYPQEPRYRHSLKEEVAALRAVVEALNNNKEVNRNKLDASLKNLLSLENDGLLEAFVLLAMPDDGIVRDFVTYRNTNIEKLRRYVVSYVLKEEK